MAATGPIVADSAAAQKAVDTAMAQRGKPYVWAATGPGSYDCSGLTSYAFRAAGISLPRERLRFGNSGSSSFAHGGTTWSRNAIADRISSTAPAPRCQLGAGAI